MKGITPIITVILLLLIAVVMVGFAFGFFSNIFTVSKTETESALNTTVSIYGKQIRVDNIDTQALRVVTVRAVGPRGLNIGELSIYNASGSSVTTGSCPTTAVNPGGTGICNLATNGCMSGSTLRVVAPGNTDTKVCP